ncbi:hypothetical protein LLEC1_06695 [Akanthomyces lecanii]|uniref:Transcription factor domain-containing protein n=1 Tax=Cordyceps confragosa TaxID=2714763 RepID=A0A179IGT6_CORDF|nr:hypothetical protein LLEC1_06695 [Akanthomyces lecanii]
MAAFILENGRLWSDPQAIALRPKKRSRKWAPKKRTGCLTCSCVVASRECIGVGYAATVLPDAADQESGSRGLVPQRRIGLVHQPDVTVSPPGVKTSEQEMMQFRFLCQVAASSMAGVFDQKFCSRDMLQATSFHPIVWHASCALAAMYQRESLLAGSSDIHGRAKTAAQRQDLRSFALEQYNQSIAGVLGIMESVELSSLDLEVLLTTTLLFTAISSLQGDMPAAILHIINGQRILQRWKRGIADAPMKMTGGKNRSSTGLLTPSSVEAVMGRLVSQSSTIRQIPWSEEYYKSLEAPVISQDAFCSPEDAYYEFEPLSKAYFELGENNKFIMDPAKRQPPFQVRMAYLAALGEWTMKFDTMQRRPGIMDSPTNREAVLVLQARQIGMEIEVQRDPAGQETTWDEFNVQFARIVALGEQLRDGLHQGAGRVFSFSSSMMDVLFVTAIRCREHGVRHRAMELLRRQNAREGLCNSRLAFAIAAGWAEIEEAPGTAKRRIAEDGIVVEGGEECACEAERFICGEHRVTAVGGEFRTDDVGTMRYWTRRALELGLPGEMRELAW